jgi:hypothetical protein
MVDQMGDIGEIDSPDSIDIPVFLTAQFLV